MAEGTISGSFIETGIKGTNNEWTYFRIGDRVIAFIYKQFSNVSINTATDASGVYRSGELTVASLPQFMTVEHYCAAPADGSETGNTRLHRIFTQSDSFKCYLYADKSFANNASYPIMVIVFGKWNGT